MMDLKIELSKNLKEKNADTSLLGFGKTFTDHMFVMDYNTEVGWHNAKIVPFGNINISPASAVLHYGQEVFEGLKAYKAKDGRVLLFRPDQNMKRLNISNERMDIPQFDEQFALKALLKLVDIDRDWIPSDPGTSLYIRPFIFATDEYLGVKTSTTYKFMIIMSPVGMYFADGLKPIKIKVESEYVRAVVGGTGTAKTGGNYASSMKAQAVANRENYSQVLWLDGVEKKYIEEVGAMNIFFVVGDEIITPSLGGSILDGITRKSIIDVLKASGRKVVERKIAIDEIYSAYQNGDLKEVFGTGTAAVVSPVGELRWGDKVMEIGDGNVGKITEYCYNELVGIQTGEIEDKLGWTVTV